MATLVVLLVLNLAGEAAAQGASNQPQCDVAATTGVFLGHPQSPDDSESFDQWYHTSTLGITAGRYLTTHLKLEGEITFSREGSRYVLRLVDVPGVGPRPVSAEQLTRTNSASGAVVWQFLDNQWVHPFLLAGATVDFDREGLHLWQQSFFSGDPRIAGNEVVVSTEHVEHFATAAHVRGLLGGGAKLYVSPNAFFRADSRIGIGRDDSGHVAFRLGFGVDF